MHPDVARSRPAVSPGTPFATVIVPVWNGEAQIGECLAHLLKQSAAPSYEVIVVDDGSTDGTADAVARFPAVRLVRCPARRGPAAARNHGATRARGTVLLFTDADCRPCERWVAEMTRPFLADAEVAGARGAYGSDQTALVARLVQAEYVERYRMMAAKPRIDYIGAYSAAYRRDVFLAAGGFSSRFAEASSEDGDLSYRLDAEGRKLVFCPEAVVLHHHPDTLAWYWRRKFKYAYWRMLAYRRTPAKMVADSHTPQLMKLQALVPAALLVSAAIDAWFLRLRFVPAVLALYFVSVAPTMLRIARRSPAVAGVLPIAFFGRAAAHFAGAVLGLLRFGIVPQRTAGSEPR